MDDTRYLEEEYLKKVLSLLKAEAERLEMRTTGELTDIEQAGYKMWDELTHVIRDFDDVAALQMYDADMARQESQYRAEIKELRNLLSLYRIPYFGRLDFTSDLDGVKEKVYIGAHSFTDRKTFEPYIYDWRTPIASAYYDSDVGPAQFACPDGIETGTISLMRRYRIRNGKIQMMYDVNTGVSDDMLGAALTENAQARLKVIVESIQREQNRAIRDEKRGDLIVIGPAGSGKTSVGLHRFAYLLYRWRESMTHNNFEIISRNGIFASYIGDILPELGEEDARCSLFEDVLLPLVPVKYDLPDYNEQIDYVMNAHDGDIRFEAIKVKSSAEFLDFMPYYFENFRFAMPDITANNEVLCTKEKFAANCQEMLETRPFEVVLTYARSYATALIEDYYEKNEKALLEMIWRAGDYFGDETSEEFIRRRRDDINAVMDFIDSGNMLEDEPLYIRILSIFLKGKPYAKEIIERTKNSIDSGRLEYEDALCIAALRAITGKAEPKRDVLQLLIDEAQDYNPFHHFILKKIYPAAQFTVLADPNQSVFPAISMQSEEELISRYSGSHVLYLTKSYRSTGPINRLACKVMGIENVDYFARTGDLPYFINADLGKSVKGILSSGELDEMDTIGIICKDKKSAKTVAKLIPDAQLYINPDAELKKGVAIIPASLCKGLEFDAVIAECSNETSQRLMYLLCTRALHRLYLVSKDKNIDILADVEDMMYRLG